MNELPVVLLPHVKISTSTNGRRAVQGRRRVEAASPATISEKDYYRALEEYLAVRIAATDGDRQDGENVARTARDVDVTLASELESYHLQHALCGGWLFDHEAHARHSYYPSNLFPLGSTEECSFFMRAWSRNVNYPYARRLYERGGRFDKVLEHVSSDVCPCEFLMAFNVTDNDEWSQGDDRPEPLTKIAVENELLFKSDFFNKRALTKQFTNTNLWVYETFVKHHHANGGRRLCFTSPERPDRRVFLTSGGREIPIDEKWFRCRTLETRSRRRGHSIDPGSSRSGETTSGGVTSAKIKGTETHGINRVVEDGVSSGDSENDTYARSGDDDYDSATYDPSPASVERRGRMRRILNSLYFGCGFMKDHDRDGFNSRVLARCEDYRSFLYSPTLGLHSCKHEHEEITFVQRRSGDEIATEVRRCKACGRVKTT